MALKNLKNRTNLRLNAESKAELTDEELREHQLIAKEALDEIKRICEKNDIPYYLIAGTCLGAVRHKGFIPWDDDIDIGILNRDYPRFEAAVSKELSDKFTWISNYTSKKYPRLFGKVLHDGFGCVDCFQLVKTADTPKGRERHRKGRLIWYKLFVRKIGCYWSGENLLFYYISVILEKFISWDTVIRMFRRNEARYENKDTHYYMNINSVYKTEKETISAEWLFPSGKVTFEGDEYSTVNDTDAYLTHLYGDYMTPTPPDKRRQKHMLVRFSEDGVSLKGVEN